MTTKRSAKSKADIWYREMLAEHRVNGAKHLASAKAKLAIPPIPHRISQESAVTRIAPSGLPVYAITKGRLGGAVMVRVYFCEPPETRADGSLARGQHDALGRWVAAGTLLHPVAGITSIYAVYDAA